jgi:hypothetical protein
LSGHVFTVGYGSLTSARGLGRHGRGIQDGWLVRLHGVRRRFAKPSQRSACLAMDLEPGHGAILDAERVHAHDPPGRGQAFEGLLLVYAAAETPDVARREGYAPALWERLRERAGPAGLAAFLLDLAQQAGDDVVAYRRALRDAAGPNPLQAYHYLPHPVRTPEGPAVIFVAPEPGQTGDPERDSAKAALRAYRPGRLDRVYQGARAAFAERAHEADAAQTRYVELCLLGAAHGIRVRDLVDSGPLRGCPTAALLDRWRQDPAPLTEERDALRALIPTWRDDAHHARVAGADLTTALRRSGLFEL